MQVAALSEIERRGRFKTALYLAFGGISLILIVGVGLALYISHQIGQAVERTTHEILPETLAALRLSERSALLAALAPTLARASDGRQLQQLAEQLDTLIDEINTHIGRLNTRIDPNTLTILRDRVSFLGVTLQTLKVANSHRVALENQQTVMLAEIGKVHGEMNDIVSPVVYGVTSLNQLLAKRVVRQRVSSLRGLQEQRVKQVLAVMELRLSFHRVVIARRQGESGGAVQWSTVTEPIRAGFGQLQAAQGNEPSPSFRQLEAVAQRFFQPDSITQSPDSLERDFERALDLYLEWLKSHLAGHLQQELDQMQATVLDLIEQMVRNLVYALDIRSEGNLLFSVLATVAEANEANNLVVLQERFKRSHDIFRLAADTFQLSELARRNPVLAGNVANIEKRLAAFGQGEGSLFVTRQGILRLNGQIQQLLTDSHRIAKAVTEQIDTLVGHVQADTEAV